MVIIQIARIQEKSIYFAYGKIQQNHRNVQFQWMNDSFCEMRFKEKKQQNRREKGKFSGSSVMNGITCQDCVLLSKLEHRIHSGGAERRTSRKKGKLQTLFRNNLRLAPEENGSLVFGFPNPIKYHNCPMLEEIHRKYFSFLCFCSEEEYKLDMLQVFPEIFLYFRGKELQKLVLIVLSNKYISNNIK